MFKEMWLNLNNQSLQTRILTPIRGVFLQKLTVLQRVKISPAFYEIQRFMSAFTRAILLSLFWVSLIQSTSSLSFKKRINIIFPSTPSSSKCTVLSVFPTKTFYAFPLLLIRVTCYAHIFFEFDCPNNIW